MEDKKPIPLKIVPFRRDNTSRTFANYVRIVSTPSEITLQFVDVKPPENDDRREEIKKKREIKMPIVAEIALPTNVAKGLLEILEKQLSKIKNNK